MLSGMKSKNLREMEKYWAEKAKSPHSAKGTAPSARKAGNRPATGKSTQPPKSM
jgi:hypothetical protein